MPADQIVLAGGSFSVTATSAFDASSRIVDSKWPEPEPKPNVVEGPEGSIQIDEADYQDRTVTLMLATTSSAGELGTRPWVQSWEQVAAAATRDKAATLVSTFSDATTLTFDVIAARFEGDLGHEHWLGYGQGTLTLTCRPFGRKPEAAVAGTSSMVGFAAQFAGTSPVEGDAPALVRVAPTWAGPDPRQVFLGLGTVERKLASSFTASVPSTTYAETGSESPLPKAVPLGAQPHRLGAAAATTVGPWLAVARVMAVTDWATTFINGDAQGFKDNKVFIRSSSGNWQSVPHSYRSATSSIAHDHTEPWTLVPLGLVDRALILDGYADVPGARLIIDAIYFIKADQSAAVAYSGDVTAGAIKSGDDFGDIDVTPTIGSYSTPQALNARTAVYGGTWTTSSGNRIDIFRTPGEPAKTALVYGTSTSGDPTATLTAGGALATPLEVKCAYRFADAGDYLTIEIALSTGSPAITLLLTPVVCHLAIPNESAPTVRIAAHAAAVLNVQQDVTFTIDQAGRYWMWNGARGTQPQLIAHDYAAALAGATGGSATIKLQRTGGGNSTTSVQALTMGSADDHHMVDGEDVWPPAAAVLSGPKPTAEPGAPIVVSALPAATRRAASGGSYAGSTLAVYATERFLQVPG